MEIKINRIVSKRHREFITLLGLIFSLSFGGFPQNSDLPTRTMPAQLTFIYPVGSNGINSYLTANHFSINILAGVSAGVKGFEIGGLSNFTRGPVNGIQLAGLANANSHDVMGIQMAGLINGVKGNVTGMQYAGLVNINTGTFKGAQGAGLINTNAQHFTGVQMAGLINSSIHGFRGVQGAGLVNVNTGNFEGLQLSGGVNVNTGHLEGMQMGLVNFSAKLDGFQIGLVNVADSIGKGGGLGLITYYGNGYHALEIEANETFFTNIYFKSGVEKLYTIYTVSLKTNHNRVYWAYGLGVGSLVNLSDKLSVNVDLISRHVNEDRWWTNHLNMLNTLKLDFGYKLGNNITLYGGPSYNIVISSIKDIEGNVIGDGFSNHAFYDKIGHRNRVKMYIGFNGGIRF